MREMRFIGVVTLGLLVSGTPRATVRASASDLKPVRGATAGCVNQNVVNAFWQVRVTGLDRVHRNSPYSDVPSTGWQVSMEWTNISGTKAKTFKADDGKSTVTQGGPNGWELTFTSGTQLGIFDHDGSRELSKAGTGTLQAGEDQTKTSDFFDRTFPPGVVRKGAVTFWYPANASYKGKPTKLTLSWEPYVEPHYQAMHFNLTCTK